jgi:hypothetical protein
MKNEVMEMESRYHLLNCQLALTDHQIRRVSSGPPAERLRERYQQKVAEAEDQVRCALCALFFCRVRLCCAQAGVLQFCAASCVPMLTEGCSVAMCWAVQDGMPCICQRSLPWAQML